MGLKISNIIVATILLIAIVIIPTIYLSVGGGFTVKHDIWLYLIVGTIGVASWTLWAVRRVYSISYKPFIGDHTEPVSVVIPIWHEHPDTFLSTMVNIMKNYRDGDEIICVFDSTEKVCQDVLHDNYPATEYSFIKEIVVTTPGKRHALVRGVGAATNPIIVLCDSDVIWKDNLVTEILKPFADPQVGGVGTRQIVAEVGNGIMRRIAMWWLDAKLLDYMPGLSNKGCAVVLSGRTAAYRRSIILPLLDDLEFEYLWGKQALSGDDGRLTMLVMKAGFKTVYQSTAMLTSSFPLKLRDFIKQRVRWARNSNRCYFRGLFEGWVFKRHPLLPLTIIHTQISSFTILAPLFATIYAIVTGEVMVFIAIFLWINAARYIRGYNHLKEYPQDVIIVPIITFFLMLVFPIIKAYSLITMNKQVWLGRTEVHDDYNWSVK